MTVFDEVIDIIKNSVPIDEIAVAFNRLDKVLQEEDDPALKRH